MEKDKVVKGIPLFGMGTYQLKKDAAREAVKNAIQEGYRLIDTARIYRNEVEVGEGIRASGIAREHVFITTKIPPTEQGDEKAYQAVLSSLNNLGVSWIDLVLIHWPGSAKTALDSPANTANRQGSWNALVRLQEEGKVRLIGTSNFQIDHLETLKGPFPAVNQVELHPFLTQEPLREYCASRGGVVQAYSSLGRASDELWNHPVVKEVATETGLAVPTVLLLWAMQQGISVIPKTSNIKRIRNNFSAFQLLQESRACRENDLPLTNAQVQRLSDLHRNKHYCWDPSTVTG